MDIKLPSVSGENPLEQNISEFLKLCQAAAKFEVFVKDYYLPDYRSG